MVPITIWRLRALDGRGGPLVPSALPTATNYRPASARAVWPRSGGDSIGASAGGRRQGPVRALAADERFRHRFEPEARHIASLAHPNIVVVHDVGVDGDRPFIVMELVKGKALRQVLAESSPLTPQIVPTWPSTSWRAWDMPMRPASSTETSSRATSWSPKPASSS